MARGVRNITLFVVSLLKSCKDFPMLARKEKKSTQENLSNTNDLFVSLFSSFCFSRFHGNYGLN